MFSSFFWKKILVRSGAARHLPSLKRILGGGEQFLHYLGDRALSSPLSEILDPAWFPDVSAPDAIHLALGTPRCEMPLGALRGVNDRRALSAWGLGELRHEILQRCSGKELPANLDRDVLITHGASGAFATAIDTFLNPGSKVVLFDPTSPIFPLGLKHRRAKIHWVETWIEEGKTRFDIEGFARAMRGARLLVFGDPCNPTGGVLAAEDLEQIAWWARRYDVLIYTDESFGYFRYDGEHTRIDSLPHTENRLLTAGSVSKSHGLSSARVGWLIGSRHLIRPCAVTAAMSTPYISPLCQHAALVALRTGEPIAATVRDEFAGRRRYLYEGLQLLGLMPMWPAGGFFFWTPVNQLGMTGREFAQQLMHSKRVLVNPGEPFGPSGEDHVRISYATEDGRLREGLQRLSEFMKERAVVCTNQNNRIVEPVAASGIRPESDKTHRSPCPVPQSEPPCVSHSPE